MQAYASSRLGQDPYHFKQEDRSDQDHFESHCDTFTEVVLLILNETIVSNATLLFMNVATFAIRSRRSVAWLLLVHLVFARQFLDSNGMAGFSFSSLKVLKN